MVRQLRRSETERPGYCAAIRICQFHHVDWSSKAAVSATRIFKLTPTWSLPGVEAACAALPLAEREKEAAWSLLHAPIEWYRGNDFLGNGNHRICGLAAAGAMGVPVARRPLSA